MKCLVVLLLIMSSCVTVHSNYEPTLDKLGDVERALGHDPRYKFVFFNIKF